MNRKEFVWTGAPIYMLHSRQLSLASVGGIQSAAGCCISFLDSSAILVHHRQSRKLGVRSDAGDSDGEAIQMAFGKKQVEDRKAWLSQFVPGTFLDSEASQISYSDFVHKVRRMCWCLCSNLS